MKYFLEDRLRERLVALGAKLVVVIEKLSKDKDAFRCINSQILLIALCKAADKTMQHTTEAAATKRLQQMKSLCLCGMLKNSGEMSTEMRQVMGLEAIPDENDVAVPPS